MGDAGDFQPRPREPFGQVKAGGVAFDVGSEGEHDFLNGLLGEPFFQFGDPEILGLDAIKGRDFSAEDVVFAAESAGFFDADDIHRAFDEADQAGVAPRVRAKVAARLFGQGAANLAGPNLVAGLDQGLGQMLDRAGFRLDEVQSDSFRGARADAGQLVQGGDQRGNSLR